jgi:predicted TIM-barrel fold metal-dependent hydrolase
LLREETGGRGRKFYLDRIDNMAGPAKLKQPVSEYFREHLFVTPAGMWSERYLRWSIEVLGAERILFSSDYPYRFTLKGGVRRFLEAADLSEIDRESIAHGNWERLMSGLRRG